MSTQKFTVFLLSIIFCCSTEVKAETLWLIVGATTQTPSPLIEAKNKLLSHWPEVSIVATEDCTNTKNSFYVLSLDKTKTRNEALISLTRARKEVADAYLLNCMIKPESRLAFGIPLIDSSLEKVPENSVNWTDNDYITEVKLLGDDTFLILKRIYDPEDEGFREGRRLDIYFFHNNPKQAHLLRPNCWDFGGESYDGKVLAFHCAHMVAGLHMIHEVEAYKLQPLQKIFNKTYCRNPHLSDKSLTCEEELVDAQGELILKVVKESLE
jgi:hypothetical protein